MKLNTKLLYVIFFIAFIIRITFFYFYNLPPELIPDTITYSKLGRDFFEFNEVYGKKYIYDSHIHMPLYSILSYLFGGRENLIIFDIILSSITSVLIYLLSFQLSNNKLVSLISSILFTLNPFLIFFSISGLTETSYIFLLILFCILILSKKFFLSFIILCISIYIRPTIEFLYPFIIFSFLYFNLSLSFNLIFKKILLFFFVYIVLLSPWWIHNFIKYNGEFVRINLAPSWSLYIGNNELSSLDNTQFARSGSNESFNLDKFDYLNNTPLIKNKKIREEAIAFILENPKKFLLLCKKRMLHFWQFYPNAIEFKNWFYIFVSVSSFSFLCFFSIFYFLNLNLKNFYKVLPIIFIILSINLVHVLTISSLRYRLPIEPFLIFFASNGIYIFLKYLSFNNLINNFIKRFS